nr:putative reverse transcriptase domain-containing protein [Tanacetum cinerariifolium]
MDQKSQARDERILEGKKQKCEKFQSGNSSGKGNQRDNSRQPLHNNQRLGNARAMVTAPTDGKLFNVKQEEVREVCSEAYAIKDVELKGPNVVIGMFLLNNGYTFVLFNLGSDRSFVDTRFISMLYIDPVKIGASYKVELADGRVVSINTVLKGCTLNLVNCVFEIDLMPIELGTFDVIIGMDWLVKHDAMNVCGGKVLRIPYGNKMVIVESNKGMYRLKVISCIKAHKEEHGKHLKKILELLKKKDCTPSSQNDAQIKKVLKQSKRETYSFKQVAQVMKATTPKPKRIYKKHDFTMINTTTTSSEEIPSKKKSAPAKNYVSSKKPLRKQSTGVQIRATLGVFVSKKKIGKCNMRIDPEKTRKEHSYQVVLDALALTTCYPAFLITASVPLIFMQQFWATINKQDSSYRFKIDKKRFYVDMKEIGHARSIKSITAVVVDHIHQPWRAFIVIINKCLSGKITGLEKIRLSRAQILWRIDGVGSQPKFPDEPKGKTTSINEGTSTKPRVPYVPKDQSKSENEFWRESEDDDDDSNDDDCDDISDDDGNDNKSNDDGNNDASDDERIESDKDENLNLNQNKYDKEEAYEDEYVRTPSSYESTDDENEHVNEEEYDWIDEELNKDVNVKLKDVKHGEEGKGDAEKTDAGHDDVTQETSYDHVEDDAHVTLTTIHDT